MAPQVTVYACGPSVNPLKVMILLEELKVEYAIVNKEFGDGPNGMKAPDFLKINPNGRVPAIVDHTNDDFIVWESAAVLMYLAERFDTEGKFNGTTLNERAEVWEWLAYQISGLGPSQGQVMWFSFYHVVKGPDLHPSVLKRYQDETLRIYSVLDKRLAETGNWLALGRLTIADIAHFPWLNLAWLAKLDLEPFPHLKSYVDRMKDLPSVKRMYEKVPSPVPPATNLNATKADP